MSRVYIGNLGEDASKRELEREFEYFGRLKDVWVARNPPGFGFVVFEDARDAEDAVRELDGKTIGGSRVRVELARGPSRGGRAQRLGLTEKCYECGRIGHFARDCTRRPGYNHRERGGGRYSRSPTRKRQRSRSRSRSPVRRRERSRSYERRDRRSPSRSRSRSISPRDRRGYSRDRSPSPNQDRNGNKKGENDDLGDSRVKRERSISPNA